MTDKQKIFLIDSILAQFMEMSSDERVANGADAILCAILAVLNFSEEA